jgi:hypothetical protein
MFILHVAFNLKIIYEKWLPYQKPADRQVILERGKIYEKIPAPKNVIIDYERPQVQVQRIVHNDGVMRVDPISYTLSQPSIAIKMVRIAKILTI